MLFVDNYELINTLKHLYEAVFEHVDVYRGATHLNYLLVAEEVETWELLALLFYVLLEVFHQCLEISLHFKDMIFNNALLVELAVVHSTPICDCNLQRLQAHPVLLVYFNELMVVLLHLARQVSTEENRSHVGP